MTRKTTARSLVLQLLVLFGCLSGLQTQPKANEANLAAFVAGNALFQIHLAAARMVIEENNLTSLKIDVDDDALLTELATVQTINYLEERDDPLIRAILIANAHIDLAPELSPGFSGWDETVCMLAGWHFQEFASLGPLLKMDQTDFENCVSRYLLAMDHWHEATFHIAPELDDNHSPVNHPVSFTYHAPASSPDAERYLTALEDFQILELAADQLRHYYRLSAPLNVRTAACSASQASVDVQAHVITLCDGLLVSYGDLFRALPPGATDLQ